MKNRLNIALIGYGKMGKHHVANINNISDAKIIAISDSKFNSNTKIAEVRNEIKLYQNYHQLFKECKPDVTHIVTPPDTHYEIGLKALQNDSHVFIEKPFVQTAKQAEELLSIAKERKLKVYAGHQLLSQNATKIAKKYFKNIGDIVHIESFFSFNKVRRSMSAVDQIIDILPHPLYTLLHFLALANSTKEPPSIISLHTDQHGEIRALISQGNRIGILLVTLKGRPVDSYLKIVGVNGTIFIDYVRGAVINLSGPGVDAISAVISPFRQGWQHTYKSTKSLLKLFFKQSSSYDGLLELISNFYNTILDKEKPILQHTSLIDSVNISEKISLELKNNEKNAEKRAKIEFKKRTKNLLPLKFSAKILVTGGNGFLGRVICQKLRNSGYPVLSISRNIPSYSTRLAGIEYRACDLGVNFPSHLLENVDAVVHCAAETSGGIEDHERNSVNATLNLIQACRSSNVSKFIHMSSIAVLKPSSNPNGMLNENSPVDYDNLSRGPYVWGKAKSELLVLEQTNTRLIDLKIIRLGPLVDYNNFSAPGRLGREVGSYFIVMGNRKSLISVCNVHTVAEVVMYYLTDYTSAPTLLNLIESGSLTRKALVNRLIYKRPDLRPVYVPPFIIAILSNILLYSQKFIFPSKKPINIASAFSSEKYDNRLAEKTINEAYKRLKR